MLAFRVFEVSQNVCARKIMSLFEQLNLYSSRQPIGKLHGQFHALVVINRKWIKRATSWACLTSVSHVSFEIGGCQKLNALQCLPLSISKTCYIGITMHGICCKQRTWLKCQIQNFFKNLDLRQDDGLKENNLWNWKCEITLEYKSIQN